MTTTVPARRPSRRRTVLAVVAIVAAVAILYAVVVALYAGTGRVTVDDDPNIPADQVAVRISPESVNAVGNRLTVSLVPRSGEGYVDGMVVAKPFSLLVTGTDGARKIDYKADQLLSPTEVQLVTDGDIERWPFDTYSAATLVLAVTDKDGNGDVEPLPTVPSVAGRVPPGWNIDTATYDGGATVTLDGKTVTPKVLVMTVSRSVSTIAFGIVLLSLMVVVPVLVLLVAIAAFRGKRKVEATLTSWMGAMLFATLPLRNFLPGSPPIGSWIDYLIVLWVLVGLVAGLVIFVAAWLRRAPVGDPPTSQRIAAAAAAAPAEPVVAAPPATTRRRRRWLSGRRRS